MNTSIQVYSLLAFLGMAALVVAVAQLLRRSEDRVSARIEEAAQSRSGARRDRSSSFRKRWAALLGRLLPDAATQLLVGDSGRRSRLQNRLIQAGLYGSGYVPLFVTAKIVLTVLPLGVALCLSLMELIAPGTALWIGAVGGGVGLLLPSLWLDRVRERRHLVFMKSLPDFLDLLITCLSSGISLEAALQRVSQELKYAHPLLAKELVRVQQEIGLGTTADAALRNFAERTDLNCLRSLATLCQQARQFGTKISDALRVHADMLRTQREQNAEERAQKAAVKILFPTLLFIFPAVFVVVAGPAAIQLWQSFGRPDAQATSVE